MELNIRTMTQDETTVAATAVGDLPLLRKYGTDPTRLDRALSEALADPAMEVLFAEPSDRPGVCAGLLWFAPSGTFLMGGYLKLLAVNPSFQGRGVGRALVAELELRVSVQSSKLFLLVSEFNHKAARFYESLGYLRAGRFEALVLPDTDEIVYWKRLQV